MQHALALARKGMGLASPNPMVGCVIVREGQIVGEGFHQYEWRDHAETIRLAAQRSTSRSNPAITLGAPALVAKQSSPRAFNAL